MMVEQLNGMSLSGQSEQFMSVQGGKLNGNDLNQVLSMPLIPVDHVLFYILDISKWY